MGQVFDFEDSRVSVLRLKVIRAVSQPRHLDIAVEPGFFGNPVTSLQPTSGCPVSRGGYNE